MRSKIHVSVCIQICKGFPCQARRTYPQFQMPFLGRRMATISSYCAAQEMFAESTIRGIISIGSHNLSFSNQNFVSTKWSPYLRKWTQNWFICPRYELFAILCNFVAILSTIKLDKITYSKLKTVNIFPDTNLYLKSFIKILYACAIFPQHLLTLLSKLRYFVISLRT